MNSRGRHLDYFIVHISSEVLEDMVLDRIYSAIAGPEYWVLIDRMPDPLWDRREAWFEDVRSGDQDARP